MGGIEHDFTQRLTLTVPRSCDRCGQGYSFQHVCEDSITITKPMVSTELRQEIETTLQQKIYKENMAYFASPESWVRDGSWCPRCNLFTNYAMTALFPGGVEDMRRKMIRSCEQAVPNMLRDVRWHFIGLLLFGGLWFVLRNESYAAGWKALSSDVPIGGYVSVAHFIADLKPVVLPLCKLLGMIGAFWFIALLVFGLFGWRKGSRETDPSIRRLQSMSEGALHAVLRASYSSLPLASEPFDVLPETVLKVAKTFR
jgi:hypothetical protein